MDQKHRELYRRSIDEFGVETELLQLCEECSELIKAVSKWWRNREAAKTAPSYKGDVVEEIADVEIKIGQLCVIMGINDGEIFEAKENKYRRLENAIEYNRKKKKAVTITADNSGGEQMTTEEIRRYEDHALITGDTPLRQINIYDKGVVLQYEGSAENMRRCI